MVHNIKKIDEIKKSIDKLNDFSLKEKESLIDSIEMLWLNSGIQKKKKDISMENNKATDHITRIRQLLAAAWSEDLKD